MQTTGQTLTTPLIPSAETTTQETISTCPYCRITTSGNHERGCPMAMEMSLDFFVYINMANVPKGK